MLLHLNRPSSQYSVQRANFWSLHRTAFFPRQLLAELSRLCCSFEIVFMPIVIDGHWLVVSLYRRKRLIFVRVSHAGRARVPRVKKELGVLLRLDGSGQDGKDMVEDEG
jgi:hypothetical protein